MDASKALGFANHGLPPSSLLVIVSWLRANEETLHDVPLDLSRNTIVQEPLSAADLHMKRDDETRESLAHPMIDLARTSLRGIQQALAVGSSLFSTGSLTASADSAVLKEPAAGLSPSTFHDIAVFPTPPLPV